MTHSARRDDGMDLVDYVRELTERHTHAEHYTVRRGKTWYGANHTTRVPSLLDQLWTSDIPSSASEEGPRAGYGSKPAARLEALDVAVHIDLAVNQWLLDLGVTDVPTDTAAAIRRLGSLMPAAEHVTVRAVTRDVRRWWMQARIVTGWDSPAWRPDATCPMCAVRGGLRVQLADQNALCVECQTTWDSKSIGLLADHIRAESEAAREPRRPREPCMCPWPKPIVADLSKLCPWCGSARCVHALSASASASVAS